jgi:hypothetical protein
MKKKSALFGIFVFLVIGFLYLGRHTISSVSRKQPKFVPPRIADRIKDIKVATLPFNLPPTKSQKAVLDKIEVKYRDKIIAARLAIENAIPPEQLMAMREASEEAQKAGKQGKELMETIQKAGNVSEEQQKSFDKARVELDKLSFEVESEISKLLNDDQKKEIKKRIGTLFPKKLPLKVPASF